jgi:transcription initiation factor IIF auxiliary subunit
MILTVNTAPLDKFKERLNLDAKKENLLRTMAASAHELISSRVFNARGGNNSNGELIGVYSAAYMKQRAKENRNNKEVNFIFTGQMHADFSIGAVEGNQITLGFQNSFNGDKKSWLQEKYGRVFDLTKQEIDILMDVATDFVRKSIGGKV